MSNFEIKGTHTGLKFGWSANFDSTNIANQRILWICIMLSDFYDEFHINAHATTTPSVDTARYISDFISTDNLVLALSHDGSSGREDLFENGAAERTIDSVNNRLSSLTLDIQDVSVFALTNLTIFPATKFLQLIFSPYTIIVGLVKLCL